MRILLDQCLPHDFRHQLPGHDVHTIDWAGLKGFKNGRLLREVEAKGYDVFLTIDRGIPHQQNLSGRKLSILLIHSRTNPIEDLLPAVSAILKELATLQPGQVTEVSGRL